MNQGIKAVECSELYQIDGLNHRLSHGYPMRTNSRTG